MEFTGRDAARFLGVAEGGFAGGRLSEYLSEDQASRIDDVAVGGLQCE